MKVHGLAVLMRVAKGSFVMRDQPKINSVTCYCAKISCMMRDWTSQCDLVFTNT